MDVDTKLPNGLVHEPAAAESQSLPSNHGTDLLIDFSDVDVELIPSVALNNELGKTVHPTSLNELDFLLTFSNDLKESTSAASSNTVDLLSADPPALQHVVQNKEEPTTDIVSKKEKLPKEVPAEVTNSSKVIGFPSIAAEEDADADLIKEFESFLATEDMPVSTTENINSPTVTRTQQVEPSVNTQPNRQIHLEDVNVTNAHLEDLTEFNREENNDNMYDTNSEDLIPLPNESIQPESNSNIPNETVNNTYNQVTEPVAEEPVRRQSPSIQSTTGSDRNHENQTNTDSSQEARVLNPDSAISTDTEDSLPEQSFPDFSPPSYSAVLAEDRAAKHHVAQQRHFSAESSHGKIQQIFIS